MEFSEVIKKRRSTRKFTDEGVSCEQILKLAEAAVIAPNACNMQSWHFYIITDKNVKAKLSGAIADWALTAPVLFVVCTAPDAIKARFGERAEVFTIQDTAAAVENILLTATDMGLGGCFMGAFDGEKFAEVLGINEDHKPIAVVPVGVPSMEMPARPRNPLSDAVTFVGEDSGEYTDAELNYRKFEVKNSNVSGAVFENADLSGSVFKNVRFDGSKFENCSFEGVDLSNCNIK